MQNTFYIQTSAADNFTIKNIRVGIAYGSGSVPSVNALSEYGYKIGYFDANDQFIEAASIPNRFVTFAKDKTVSISGNSVSEAASGTKIGAFHIQLSAAYSTFSEAFSAAASAKELLSASGVQAAVFPAFIDGAYRVRIGEYVNSADAYSSTQQIIGLLGQSADVVGNDPRAVTVIDMNEHYTVFEISVSGFWPTACPQQKDGEPVQRLKNGTKYYRGYFEFKRLTGENITFINVVTLQDYVKGVVPYEIGSNVPLEAVKAQAIAARNYAVSNLNKHRSSGFNLCATTDCQVYNGCGAETENTNAAVDQTNGMVLTYEGTPIEAFYHSSNGGYTESNSNAWGSAPMPYYSAVPDPYEDLTAAIHGTWSVSATADELTAYLKSKGKEIGQVKSCYVSKFTDPAHNVYEITFADDAGKTVTVSKTDSVRIFLGSYVYSPRFVIETRLDANVNGGTDKLGTPLENTYAIGGDGVAKSVSDAAKLTILTGNGKVTPASDRYVFVFKGTGWGHNVGMSQNGAIGMAKAGKTGMEILTYYFQGTKIETYETLKN